MMKKIIIYILFFFVLLWGQDNRKVYFIDPIFGLDVNSLSKDKLIKICKEKKIKFISYNPYRAPTDDISKHVIVETKYFPDNQIDKDMIVNVSYDFTHMAMGNAILVTFKWEYYDVILSQIKRFYGKETEQVSGHGRKSFIWKCSDNSSSSLKALIFYYNEGDKDYCYLEFIGKDLD